MELDLLTSYSQIEVGDFYQSAMDHRPDLAEVTEVRGDSFSYRDTGEPQPTSFGRVFGKESLRKLMIIRMNGEGSCKVLAGEDSFDLMSKRKVRPNTTPQP